MANDERDFASRMMDKGMAYAFGLIRNSSEVPRSDWTCIAAWGVNALKSGAFLMVECSAFERAFLSNLMYSEKSLVIGNEECDMRIFPTGSVLMNVPFLMAR